MGRVDISISEERAGFYICGRVQSGLFSLFSGFGQDKRQAEFDESQDRISPEDNTI